MFNGRDWKEKFRRNGNGDRIKQMKNFDSEILSFSLTISYGGLEKTRIFPNGLYRKPTIRAISKIIEEFKQEFICFYAEKEPGTQLSITDLDVSMQMEQK